MHFVTMNDFPFYYMHYFALYLCIFNKHLLFSQYMISRKKGTVARFLFLVKASIFS